MNLTLKQPCQKELNTNVWYAKIWGTAKLKSTVTTSTGDMKVFKKDAGIVMNYDKNKLIAGIEASAKHLFMKEWVKKTGVTTFEFISISYEYEIYS